MTRVSEVRPIDEDSDEFNAPSDLDDSMSAGQKISNKVCIQQTKTLR